MGRCEVIVFQGVKFRRYPDSPHESDRRYYCPGIGDRQRGVKRLHEEIWQAHNGPIPAGHHVHHGDHDHLNNDPGNLELLTVAEHKAHHAQHTEHLRTPKHLAHLDRIRPAASAWHRSDAAKALHVELGRLSWENREPVRLACQQCGDPYETLTIGPARFCSNKCKSAWRRAAGLDDEDRTCERCGETFRANRYTKVRFCSRSCSARHNADRRAL